jgi:hypothetical protein
MNVLMVIGRSRIKVRIRRPRTDRCLTSAAGGLIEQSKSFMSLVRFRVCVVSPCRHETFSSKGNKPCVDIVGFHLVTGSSCGAIGGTPVSMGSDLTRAHWMNSSLGLRICIGEYTLVSSFHRFARSHSCLFGAK